MRKQLEKFIIEKDLENEIKSYFKEGQEYKFTKTSSITGKDIKYIDAQLMSMFSIDAEIDIFNILKSKYGNRVRHNGGTQITDIDIEGTNLSYNVKVTASTVTSIKLCAVSTPKLLAVENTDFEYRFLAVFYQMNEARDAVVFNNVCVFNYKDIECATILTGDGNLVISKSKVLEYIDRRDRFINGELSEFRDMSITSADKPMLTEEDIIKYLQAKEHYVSAKKIKKTFYKHKKDLSNLSNVLNTLVAKGTVVENLSKEYKLINTSIICNGTNKLAIARIAYQEFRQNKLKTVSNLKDLSSYLVTQHNFDKQLANKYVARIEKEERVKV